MVNVLLFLDGLRYMGAMRLFIIGLFFAILPAHADRAEIKALLIEGERKSALELIEEQLKMTSQSQKLEYARLKNHALTVIFNDNTQRLLEYGKSLMNKSPQKALEQLNKAAKLEPLNQTIKQLITEVQIKLGQCGKAKESAEQVLKFNPQNKLSTSQHYITTGCLKEKIENKDHFWALFARANYGLIEEENNLRELFFLKDMRKDFPETYRLIGDAALSESSMQIEYYQRYVQLCHQSLNEDDRRVFPLLCEERKNVEDKIAALREKKHSEQAHKL